jgi:hypothetical protein
VYVSATACSIRSQETAIWISLLCQYIIFLQFWTNWLLRNYDSHCTDSVPFHSFIAYYESIHTHLLCYSAVIPVHINKQLDIIQSGGVEVRGVRASTIAKRKNMSKPVLEKYVFTPYIEPTHLELHTSLRACTDRKSVV